MKSASAALIALLATDQFLMADMLTITLADGTIGYYTSWDQDLTLGGHTYLSGDMQFKRGTTKLIIGVQVDTLTLTLYADNSNTLGGNPILSLIRAGGFDGARIKIDRLFMATPGDVSAGTASLFNGRVTDASVNRTEAQITVSSDLILLNVQMPRNVYQPSCTHTLYDDDMLAAGGSAVGCTLNKASFAQAKAVIGAGTTQAVIYALTGMIVGFFDLGYVVFTSGANSGLKRTVKHNETNRFTLSYPLPSVPADGDTFTAYPGCDKTQATCTTKFSNVTHFRGFPYVPTPETSI